MTLDHKILGSFLLHLGRARLALCRPSYPATRPFLPEKVCKDQRSDVLTCIRSFGVLFRPAKMAGDPPNCPTPSVADGLDERVDVGRHDRRLLLHLPAGSEL